MLNEVTIKPQEINDYFEKIGSALMNDKQKVSKIVLRPNVSLTDLLQYSIKLNNILQKSK